jgi:hypothetical protein
MIQIVKNFIIKKRLILYGGSAINNILPKEAQFYDYESEIPDLDFFSTNALNDAKELADIYHKANFKSVEAKTGVHHNTYKIFVNFIPMADITCVGKEIYKTLLKDAIVVDQMHHCPANYLRLNMYLELSRPLGDTSRWEKVSTRLGLLNKYYPMRIDEKTLELVKNIKSDDKRGFSKTYDVLKDELINQNVIFFGDFASSLYAEYMSGDAKTLAKEFKTFRVIHEDPEKCLETLTNKLKREGVKNVNVARHKEIEELIPSTIEIKIDGVPRVVIYEPLACHNYNEVKVDGKSANIATIDTMITFYLASYYTSKDKNFKNRVFCVATNLFELTQRRLEEEGILKRFSPTCMGEQTTLISMRAEKTHKREELKNKRGTEEYESWFLSYIPSAKKEKKADSGPATEEPATPEAEEKQEEEEEEEEEKEQEQEQDEEQELGEEPEEKPEKAINSRSKKNNYKGRNFKKNFTRKNIAADTDTDADSE